MEVEEFLEPLPKRQKVHNDGSPHSLFISKIEGLDKLSELHDSWSNAIENEKKHAEAYRLHRAKYHFLFSPLNEKETEPRKKL